MKALRYGIFAVLALSFAFVLSSIFYVQEAHEALVLRLGKIEKIAGEVKIFSPGLNFKWPFITQAKHFDKRLQGLSIESSRIFTSEKKDVLVDYFVKWRIVDLQRFYTRTSGSFLQAQTLLEQTINSRLRNEFGLRTIQEVVSGGRSDITKLLKDETRKVVGNLGVEVIDIRIKRIDLPQEVSNAVYERMRVERNRIATKHRAEGRSKADQIRAGVDRKVTVIVAEAESKNRQLRGEGEASAAKIYADAYQKNPDFFAFYRSINAYQHAFGGQQDLLVLKPEGQFFKYFKEGGQGGKG